MTVTVLLWCVTMWTQSYWKDEDDDNDDEDGEDEEYDLLHDMCKCLMGPFKDCLWIVESWYGWSWHVESMRELEWVHVPLRGQRSDTSNNESQDHWVSHSYHKSDFTVNQH